jgi:hypothetical protein
MTTSGRSLHLTALRLARARTVRPDRLWAQPASWNAKASRRAPRTARASRCGRTAARQRPPGRSSAASGASGAGFRRFRRRPRPPELGRQLQHALALLRLLPRRAVGSTARRGARAHPRWRLARNLRGVPSAPAGRGGRAGSRASDVVPKSAAPRGRGTSPLFVRTACAPRAQPGGAAGAARHTPCAPTLGVGTPATPAAPASPAPATATAPTAPTAAPGASGLSAS